MPTNLNLSMNKQEFNEIKETIKANEEATINILKPCKFKKFNYFKYIPQKNEDVNREPKYF